MPTRDDRPPVVPRVQRVSRNGAPHPMANAANAANERGLTVTHMLTAVVAMGVAIVALFLVVKPSPRGPQHRHEADGGVDPPAGAERAATRYRRHRARHPARYRRVRPRQGSAGGGVIPRRRLRARAGVVVRRDCTTATRSSCTAICRNGVLVASNVVAAVTGRPLVACTPTCGHFQQIRFSYDGPTGLTSVVAYRSGRAR